MTKAAVTREYWCKGPGNGARAMEQVLGPGKWCKGPVATVQGAGAQRCKGLGAGAWGRSEGLGREMREMREMRGMEVLGGACYRWGPRATAGSSILGSGRRD
jgi:hypothetical protein